jgi:Zn finger protein HypA/HybF involved in hydrogenase expression
VKEIIVKFQDHIAEQIADTAEKLGITSEDLIRYITGRWCSTENENSNSPQAHWAHIKKKLIEAQRDFLKSVAARGEIKCKNCTMSLKPEDFDKGECGSCHANLGNMFPNQIGGIE